ncbi:MAG: helix-turn-helix domain-containing protein [Spirochaetales bacterium]
MAWHSRYHAHAEREYELHYFLEGAGSFLNHRAKYPIRKESLFLTGPHEFHSILPDTSRVTKQPISYYAVLFALDPTDRELHQILESQAGKSRDPIFLTAGDHFIFETLYHQWGGPQVSQKKAAQYLLLSILYSRYGTNMEPAPASAGGWIHVQKAIELMKRDIKEKYSVKDIARKIGISEEHLIRLFKEHLRISPLQYALRLRVEAASGVLIGTNATIKKISDSFGFENQFHFSRVFRKCTGLPPSLYRTYYLQAVDLFPPSTAPGNAEEDGTL